MVSVIGLTLLSRKTSGFVHKIVVAASWSVSVGGSLISVAERRGLYSVKGAGLDEMNIPARMM